MPAHGARRVINLTSQVDRPASGCDIGQKPNPGTLNYSRTSCGTSFLIIASLQKLMDLCDMEGRDDYANCDQDQRDYLDQILQLRLHPYADTNARSACYLRLALPVSPP